eukprot:9108739-Pyramimonas_sp.AAC.1
MPRAGLAFADDARRPVRLPLEDNGRAGQSPAPSKRNTRAVLGHDSRARILEARADRADQLEIDAGGRA